MFYNVAADLCCIEMGVFINSRNKKESAIRQRFYFCKAYL